MKVSVIVAVYKDVEALELIIDALKRQTYKKFEVVVVEDGDSHAMKEYISTISGLAVIHTTQNDQGVRKAKSQNNGLIVATGEYLIFIDGDCIPHKNFVESHVLLSEEKTALSGRRMNIPINIASNIRNEKLDILDIENNLWKYSSLVFTKEVRLKQAVYINPSSMLYRIISSRNASTAILGCNFSCFKKDMTDINGFDESYGETAIPDDMDWEWRFQASGVRLKSCKNAAIIYHLDHKVHNRGDASVFLEVMYERKRNKQFVCDKGLNTHE